MIENGWMDGWVGGWIDGLMYGGVDVCGTT